MITDQFWIFVVSGLLLNLTPGNDMLYVIARSSGGSVRAGIVSALGIGAGCFVHMLAAVAGLSALVAQSALAFEILKYAGAAYLVYLGIRSIFDRSTSGIRETTHTRSMSRIFWQGVLTNVLNPKVALFFLAFLPQFIDPSRGSLSMQILFLGSWFNLMGTLVNILVALIFGRLGARLSRIPKFIQWQQRFTGIILMALGIRVALTSRN
jgi:threonine/homoserine/homoserine lactone efflux protein